MSQAGLAQKTNVDLQSKHDGKNSFCRKFKYVISHITVEPLVFFYTSSAIMIILVTQNLSLEKACRVNLKMNESICDAMVLRNKSGYLPNQEIEVQQLVVKWAAYRAILIGSIPLLAIIFLGSWSDRHRRRKPIILIPMFGDLIGSIGLFVCSYYFLELSIEYSWAIDTFSYGLFGSHCSVYLGVYSYVAGISSDEEKTIRIGSVSMTRIIGISTGMFMSGIVLNRLGFLGAYSVTSLFFTTAILYGIITIKENEILEEKEQKIGLFRDLFAMTHVKNTFSICFQKREGNKRTRILVLIFICMMLLGPLHGEMNVQYMYVRLKFGWNEVDYSIYNAFHFSIQFLGNFFALSLFSKYLKWDDAILGIIGMMSKLCASIMYAFVPSGMYYFFAAVFEMFNAIAYIAMRAIMAKIVPVYELGQTNSIFGICEALMPFIFGPIYSKIYIVTATTFPGTFFLFSGCLYILGFCFFLYLYKSKQEDAKHMNSLEEQNGVQLYPEKNRQCTAKDC
ncbi:hypothetical protein HHI36_003456 [Cryptolaemus montrouzieri]|uniref:Proton-coupled folate transporter n=1 Tax=Cryptolaemus montrouzieri TaxID=559131 RepID=A0ABD2PDY2_9CUCU